MKKKLNLVLVGSTGRMGQEILKLTESHNCEVIFEINSASPNYPQPKVKVDVVVDFSTPEVSGHALQWCLKNKIPFVTGTTGWSSEQLVELQSAGEKIPVFFSSNMSLGVNALAECLKNFSKQFKADKIEIIETHHIHKKDKPSGTALLLQDAIEGKVVIQSIREGDVFGIHKVFFYTKGERLGFEHHAMSREIFAEGALKAAEWLAHKGPGFYNMKDLLK